MVFGKNVQIHGVYGMLCNIFAQEVKKVLEVVKDLHSKICKTYVYFMYKL